MRQVLDQRERELRAGLRQRLAALAAVLDRLDAPPAERETLERVRRQLDELFLLVVVGEFNSGKSALINALLGAPLLEEGVTPTTSQVQVLRHAPERTSEQLEPSVVALGLPVDWLQEIQIVDTPGTNAVMRRHQEVTEEYVPRADLVLFVTSADRPFSESERAFLQGVRDWGKKIVVVLNKVDILEGEGALEEVLGFLRDNARELLGTTPPIFALSVRAARRAAEADPAERERRLRESGLPALEGYVLSTLDERERLRLKLESPLGVAERLAGRARETVAARLELLHGDVEALAEIEAQLEGYATDLRRDFGLRLHELDAVLHELRARGDRFFTDTIRIGRFFDLLNAARLRAEFERQVIGDVHARIEGEVSTLIDWMVDRNYRQWRDLNRYLEGRAAAHADRLVGELGGDFEINRQQLLASVGRAAREVVAGYDRHAEAIALSESVQRGLAAMGAVEVGAFGLGAVLLHALTRALDPLGILAAGGLALLGLYILPARRRAAQGDLERKLEELRERLRVAMTLQFERELERALERIREAIAPYTRFIRAEDERLTKVQRELDELRAALPGLRRSIGEALGPPAG